MEAAVDFVVLLLAKGAAAVRERVKAAQQRDLERMKAQAAADEEREARRKEIDP